jgi:dTDP-4-amino-4,6-dideoxygalactose transaminase
MIGVREIASVARHQAGQFLRVARGLPLQPPSLVCMTLDVDDLAIAAAELNERHEWRDPRPVAEFETAFGLWNRSATAIAMASGREALTACIHALGLRAGDEVIIPGYTCVVVVNAFRFEGITPVFADIELETYGADVTSVVSRISPRTRAIVIQHLYGLISRDYEAVLGLARDRGLRVIEDCAHAAGAEYGGIRAGNRGDAAFYSCEQSKVLNTIMGGVATANDPTVGARLRDFAAAAPAPDDRWTEQVLRGVRLGYSRNKDPRRWWRRDWEVLRNAGPRLTSTSPGEIRGERPAGYGRRMSAPVAKLGLNQLRKIDGYNERRRATAARWDRWCAEHGYRAPLVLPGSTPVFLRYPVMVEPARKRDRDWALREEGVELGVWFASQLHPAPGVVPGCPNAAAAVAGCVNFPCLL